MKIAMYHHEKDNDPKIVEDSWEGLAELLADFQETPCTATTCTGKKCPHKFGAAWSPVDIAGTRADVNVRAVTALVLDLDGLTHAQLADVAQRLDGLTYIAHSTHSHRPPESNCLRVAVELTRPVPAQEWRGVLARAVAALGIPADPMCTDLSRLYFLGSHPAGVERLFAQGAGKPLDVDALLASQNSAKTPTIDEEAEALDTLASQGADATALDFGALRARVADVRRSYAHSTRKGAEERYELLDNVLAGKALAQEGKRDNSVNKAASIIACALPLDTPAEACVELMRESIGAMPRDDTDPKDTLDAWLDKVRTSYARAMKRRKEREEALAATNAAIRERLRGNVAEQGSAPTPVPDWTKRLILNTDGSLKNCGHNIGLILRYADEVRGTLRFNEVSKAIDVFGGPFADEPKQTLHTGIANWLQEHIGILASPADVRDQIARVARFNSYDPLAEHLRGLVWDGTPRLDRVLEVYFGAQVHDDEGKDLGEYLRLIGPKWFISAVARALEPGSKVDTVLVLEGPQGIKKSTALAVLGGAFFCDTQLKIGDKDSTMLAAQYWLIELAELAAMKRSETESQKAFITRRADAIRPPYGHVVESFPRRAVFVGTTNDTDYLIDPTGNRRFWPVRVLLINLAAILRDRAQLWAEAVKRFNDGERWWLEPDEARVAEAQAQERYQESPLVEQIAVWWGALAPARRPAHVGTHDVAVAVLSLGADRVTRAVESDIGKALARLGFTRTRLRVDGRLAYRYAPSDELRDMPQGKAAHLRLISNAPVPVQKG